MENAKAKQASHLVVLVCCGEFIWITFCVVKGAPAAPGQSLIFRKLCWIKPPGPTEGLFLAMHEGILQHGNQFFSKKYAKNIAGVTSIKRE